jgi:hypothetical protein
MSTEIFPTRLILAAEFIDQPLEGFEWHDSSRGSRKEARVLRRLPDLGSVTVYVGNGPYSLPRGYKPDAVWFEAFGGGIDSYGQRLGQFFFCLGREIDLLDARAGRDHKPIRFVTELGATITPDGGEDEPDWDDDERNAALRAMQATPGSTSRYFHAPMDGCNHAAYGPFVPPECAETKP